MNLRSALTAAALAGATALTWWLARDEEAAFDADVPAQELPPGYYLRDARLMGTDERGEVTYRLSAREATQALEGDPIRLHEVTLEYTPAAEVPWRLRGDEAEVSEDLVHVHLSGNVEATSTRGPTVIRTASLRLDTGEHVARTDEPVELELPEGRLQSTGLIAWLGEERLRLESNVHGTFLP